jgi:hypothetical protein
MSNFVAYTANADGSINVLAGSSNPDVFAKILPTGTQYEVHEGETYSAGGKTWLSDEDEGYIEAKKQEEKQKALSDLDNDYNQQKAILSEQYTSAMMADDAELADEVKAELTALNEWYDEEYAKIVGEE